MSRQIQVVCRATTVFMLVAVVLSGCAVQSPPLSPEQQLVLSQRNEKGLYDKSLISYRTIVGQPNTYSRAQILEAYQALLYQYSVAAVSWVRVVYPAARQTLPPTMQPLPAPSGTPTLADVNRDYEHVLAMNATMWEINGAATLGWASKYPVPKYDGRLVMMPDATPLPPLQDMRDPQYARLVAMTKKVDAAQKADIDRQRVEAAKKLAESGPLLPARSASSEPFDPMTGRPYPSPSPPPQPEVQRWCMRSSGSVVARIPC